MTENSVITQSSVVLYFEKEAKANEEAFHTYIADTLVEVNDMKYAEVFSFPLDFTEIMKDGRAYALIALDGPENTKGKQIDELRKAVKNTPEFSVGLTGGQVIEEEAAQEDLIRAELIGLPIALIVLLPLQESYLCSKWALRWHLLFS